VPAPEPTEEERVAKELRNARKKLKSIEELEAKGTAALDPDQVKKVEGKAAVVAQVEALQAKLTALSAPPAPAPAPAKAAAPAPAAKGGAGGGKGGARK
jgi:hypothetical protein